MMPALLIRTSMGSCHDDAKARTDDRELRSSSRTSVSAAMPFATARPLAGLRTASTTCAPAWASASAVALPSPLVAPVTMNVLPVKSGRSAAVQFVTVMRDSLRKVRLCEWWTGHHGTATALDGATSQTAGARRNTGYSLTMRSKSTSGARRVIGKNGRAPAEISR